MKKRFIFITVFIAYTSIYIARLNLSTAGPDLIGLGVLDAAKLGMLGSVFSVVFSIGRLINGALSDNAPPWKMISTGLIIAGISNIAVGFLPPYAGIFCLWTANAYAQSMLWSSILCVVASIYDKKEVKKKTSVMVTSVAVGNIFGIIINTFMIVNFGVRYAFWIPGALTLALSIPVIFATKHISAADEPTAKRQSVLELLKNRELLLMCAPAMFHGMMKENVSLWMAVFVVDTYSVDLTTSSYYILLIPVIGFIGRILYPAILKLCKNNENKVSEIGFFVCIAAALILCLIKTSMLISVLALSVIYAAASVINTSVVSIYPLHYAKTGNSASVSGFLDFATYLGGGISSAVYGMIIEHFGYTPMFASWIAISVLSPFALRAISSLRKKVCH